MRESYLGIGIDVMDSVVGTFVSISQNLVDAIGHEITFFLRGPLARGVGSSDDGGWFIQWNPKFHLVVKFIDHMASIAFEVDRKFGGSNATFITEPQWKRPVPEGDEGGHTTFMKSSEDVAVVSEFLFIKLPFDWFNARPFDRETMSIVMKGFGQVEVFTKTVVVIAGDARDIILGVFGFGAEAFPVFDVTEFGVSFFG